MKVLRHEDREKRQGQKVLRFSCVSCKADTDTSSAHGVYETLAISNPKSDTSHTWPRTQMVTHPSTTTVHCCLTSVSDETGTHHAMPQFMKIW